MSFWFSLKEEQVFSNGHIDLGEVRTHFNNLSLSDATTFIHDAISREKGRLVLGSWKLEKEKQMSIVLCNELPEGSNWETWWFQGSIDGGSELWKGDKINVWQAGDVLLPSKAVHEGEVGQA